GEFGHIVMSHSRQVKACHERKVVCCEEGNEALYPGAVEYVHVQRRLDRERRARTEQVFTTQWHYTMARRFSGADFIYPSHDADREDFVPVPFVEQAVGPVDVVVCPRKRQ